MIRLSVAFIVALSLAANCVYAQVPGGGKGKASLGKASLQLLEKMSAGTSQDLIVVYDDKAIQEEAEAMQSQMGLPSHHPRIIEHKATRYAEKKQEVHSAFGPHEATVLKHYSHLPLSFVRVHSRAALDKLLAHPGVVGVYEDRVEHLQLAESLPLVGQPQVAAQGYLGAGTTVAVLDSGTDYTRSPFGSCTAPGVPAGCKVTAAADFIASDGQLDTNGHGTNVAGIVLGVAPGSKIASLRVLDATGNGNSTYTINAINWSISNKATYNIVAMNLSLGSAGKYTSPSTASPYYAAFASARAAGILPIVASGNDAYTDGLALPGAVVGAVSVGAVYDSAMGSMYWGNPLRCQDNTTAADKVTCFSNSASFLTLLAPGSQILAAGITESGTSQATPHVAGAVAVLRAAFPSETLDQTVARLTNGVMVTDSRNDIIKPRLDLPMALGLITSCTYSILTTSNSFNSNSSSGSIGVTTGAGCTWGAASSNNSASWITVTSGSSGSGNGTVNYSVSANPNSFSRTGTLTVAGQIFTVYQSGVVGTLANILLNPGFEGGPVSWTSQTANGYPVISTYLNPVANNSWYAWFCGYDYCADSLYQDVTIPADAQNAYVQFNYWITTAETSTVTAYDKMTVRIYSPPSASTYATCPPLSNLNATTGWVQSTSCNLIGYKGQTIRLQFSATTDSSFATSFFVDDVTLMVSGATADTQAPTVPAGLNATAISTSAINLAWQASTDNVGVTSYRLYRDGALLATLGNVVAYSDTGLATATSHNYTVSACDAAGNCSAQSAAVLATTDANYYQASSIVFVGTSTEQVSGSLVNITINKIQNQSSTYTSDSLRIELWAMNAPYAYSGTVRGYNTASIRTYLITGASDQLLPNGSFSAITLSLLYTAPPTAGYTHYVLFLKEYDPVNCLTVDHFCVIDYMNYQPVDTQPPTVPTGLTATVIDSSHINLAWTASADNVGVTAYKVYSSGTLVATLGNVTSSLRTNAPSTTYSYTVSACDAAGNCSAQSVSALATTPAGKTNQTISFGAAPTIAVGGTGTVSATATSGLAVSFISATPRVCTVSGSTVTGITTGTCTIAADQAGNANYNAAPQVTQSIAVGATTVLEMPWFTKVSGYISRFVLLNTGSSAAPFNISILTEAGNSAVINSAQSSGSIPANTQYVINVDNLIQSFSVGQRAAAIITSSAPAGTLTGIYNLVQPTTGAISNISLLRGQDFSSSSSVLLAPWFSTASGYASAFILSNAGSADATATVSFFAPSGTSISPKLGSLTVPAQGQLVVDTSTMVTLTGGTSAAAVFSLNAPEGYIKGTYKIVNTTNGTASSTELVNPQSSSGSTTRLVTPWFSTASGYTSSFILTNRGNTAASYAVTVMTEPGNMATLGNLSGSIPAGGQIILPASSIVSGFTGASRASAILDISGSPANIEGEYGIVSQGTGAISTTILARGDTSGSMTTTLKLPWFSGATGYISRFVLVNRGSTGAPFTIQILPEAGNSVTQILTGGTIPAQGQLVLPITDVVSGFTTATRAAAVFTVAAPAADIDGLYNIVNPISGTISNTMMGR